MDLVVCSKFVSFDAEIFCNAFAVEGVEFLLNAGFLLPNFNTKREGGQDTAVAKENKQTNNSFVVLSEFLASQDVGEAEVKQMSAAAHHGGVNVTETTW